MHNIVDNIKIEQVVKPQTIAVSELSTDDIDMQGSQNLAIAVMVGDITDILSTSAKIDLKIEHADQLGVYEACIDSDVSNFTNLTSGIFESIDDEAKEAKRYVIEYKGSKRFVKVTATPTGLSTGGEIAMLALKANHAQNPVDNS